ncbi:MAG: hypothetical protein HY080_14620 [Gammaproteobacteria bacterium]|nr:hypothetical protein [Gammaproteobacteria bacterium]
MFLHRTLYLIANLVMGGLLCSAVYAANPVRQGPTVLAKYPLLNPNQSIQIVIAPCKKKSCKILVQLVNNTQLINQFPLKWDALSAQVAAITADHTHGVGDPLDTTTQWPAWSIGPSDDSSLVVLAQPITLTGGVQGLAVHQTAGYEQIVRYHALFIVNAGKLVRAWETRQSERALWSTLITPSQAAAPIDEFIYLETVQTDNEDSPHEIDIRYLNWDTKNQTLQEKTTGNTSLYFLALYPYNTLNAATRFDTTYSNCLTHYVLVNTHSLKTKTIPAHYAFIAVTQQKTLAAQIRNSTLSCLGASARVKVDIF